LNQQIELRSRESFSTKSALCRHSLRLERRSAVRDNAAVQFTAFADAAFLRERSVFVAVMKRASPKQPLKFG